MCCVGVGVCTVCGCERVHGVLCGCVHGVCCVVVGVHVVGRNETYILCITHSYIHTYYIL